MCYLITIGVPLGYQHHVKELDNHCSVSPSSNPTVARLFPSDHALFTLTDGHCSCAFYIKPARMTADHAQARARAEYQKKGWSEAKISRALQSKRESESRREDKYAIFRQSMAALVDAIGPVRLFVHMYGGELKTENVGIAKQLTVYLQDFESSAESFPSDTILTLMRQGARKRS